MQSVKLFWFDLLFIFTTTHISQITYPNFLTVLELLELTALPCLYINPMFTHLASLPILQPYFQQVYPNFYHFRQDPTVENFPLCLTIFASALILLALLRKQKSNVIITAAQVVLTFLPTVTFRIVSEMLNIATLTQSSQVAAAVIIALNLVTVPATLIYYRKAHKFTDLAVGFLLFCNVHQYVVLAFLGVRIVVVLLLAPSSPAKTLKLAAECSLYTSVILLMFIKPSTINYIVVLSLVVVSVLYPAFNLVASLRHRDITLVRHEEDDAYCTDEHYSMNELRFFQQMNAHLVICAHTQCRCREVVDVPNLRQLKTWVEGFMKSKLKISARGANGASDSQLFSKQVEYIGYCVGGQQLDFEGYLKLHELVPTNIFQQYQKYHLMKIYALALQKQVPKALGMNIVNNSEESNPYKDFLALENKISAIISKVKVFWQQLLYENQPESFVTLVEQISADINEVGKLYHQIVSNYDEKQEADYYFSVFRLLALHEKPSICFFNRHDVNYLLVSEGDKITNMTTNTTHLLEKEKSGILGHRYTAFMHHRYGNDHGQWVRDYFSHYKIMEERDLVKAIAVSEHIIKVAKMNHMLVPHFGGLDLQDNGGVNVVTLIRQGYEQSESDAIQNREIGFHLLVDRESLDLIAYQSTIFKYFDQKFSIENCHKLLRSNLRDLFPNVNREAIINNHNGRILIAKQNKDFFNQIQEQTRQKLAIHDPSQTLAFPLHEGMNINVQDNSKKALQKHLQIFQVPSARNRQLNLLLLGFNFLVDKEEKEKKAKTSKQLQLTTLKQKTLKMIAQQEEKGKEDQTKSTSELYQLEIVMFLSFFFAFSTIVAIQILGESKLAEVQPFIHFYSKKSQFLTCFAYTQAYHLNLAIGKDKYGDMLSLWNYNENYPDVLSVYNSINQLAFKNRFDYYVEQFRSREGYESLGKLLLQTCASVNEMAATIYILFWCCLACITANLIASLWGFFRNQANSVRILSSFLTFSRSQITRNIKKLNDLQKLLEIQEYVNNIGTQEAQDFMNKSMDKNEDESEPSFHLIEKPEKQNGKNSKEKKKRVRIASKQEKKEKLQMILSIYFQNVSKNQKQLKEQDGENSAVPILKKERKERKSIQFIKESRHHQVSILEEICKNKGYMGPLLLRMLLKLLIGITVLLYVTQLMSWTVRCIEYRHKLYYQPTITLTTIYDHYLELGLTQKALANYEFEVLELLNRLPVEFAQFRSLATALQSNSLCMFIGQHEDSNLQLRCRNNPAMFQSGLDPLVEFIEQQLRLIEKGAISKQVLLQDSNLTLALRVYLLVQAKRNQAFSSQFQFYFSKYTGAAVIPRWVSATVFVLCLYLQIKEIKLAKDMKDRTDNLFKIVPPFMKSQLQKDKVEQDN